MTYTTASGIQIPQGTDAFNPPSQFKDWADKAATYENYVVVATIAERDALAAPVLRTGLLVLVTAENVFYLWSGSAWAVVASAPIPVTVTPQNGVDWSVVKVRRVGSRIFIEGTVSRTSDITAQLVGGTLPPGARPASDFLFAASAMTVGFTPSFCPVIISSDGSVKLNAPVAVAANARYVGMGCSFEIAS